MILGQRSEWVNLNQFPDEKLIEKCRIKPGEEITIGDMHAHALKMLQFLIVTDILQVPQEFYPEIVNIYRRGGSLNRQGKERFREIILEKSKVRKVDGMLVRFLGDLIADRGENDYFILIILQALRNAGVPVDIILSNHDLQHIKDYEAGTLTSDDERSPLPPDKIREGAWLPEDKTYVSKYKSVLTWKFANSLYAYGRFIKDPENQFSVADAERLLETAYLAQLNIVSCRVEEKSGEKSRAKVHIFSHAPTDINDIAFLAHYFKVDASHIYEPYEHKAEDVASAGKVEIRMRVRKEANPRDLIALVDAINARFKALVKAKKLYASLPYNESGSVTAEEDDTIPLGHDFAGIGLRYSHARALPSRQAWGYGKAEDLPFDVEVHHGHHAFHDGMPLGQGLVNYNSKLGIDDYHAEELLVYGHAHPGVFSREHKDEGPAAAAAEPEVVVSAVPAPVSEPLASAAVHAAAPAAVAGEVPAETKVAVSMGNDLVTDHSPAAAVVPAAPRVTVSRIAALPSWEAEQYRKQALLKKEPPSLWRWLPFFLSLLGSAVALYFTAGMAAFVAGPVAQYLWSKADPEGTMGNIGVVVKVAIAVVFIGLGAAAAFSAGIFGLVALEALPVAIGIGLLSCYGADKLGSGSSIVAGIIAVLGVAAGIYVGLMTGLLPGLVMAAVVLGVATIPYLIYRKCVEDRSEIVDRGDVPFPADVESDPNAEHMGLDKNALRMDRRNTASARDNSLSQEPLVPAMEAPSAAVGA